MIVVTGAEGFIGSYVIRELQSEGYAVYPVGREQDVANSLMWADLPKRPGVVEAVVHCAAKLMIDGHPAVEYTVTNTLGTLRALEYCERVGAKLIYLHTHSDMNAGPKYINEHTPRNYKATDADHLAFIVSKVAAVEMIEAYNRSKKVYGVTLRLANVRGVGSKDTNYNCVFHQFVKKAMYGQDIEIWGKHETVRDLIYVKDVARAVRLAIRKAKPELYNIGSGVGLTILDEAKAIIRTFNRYHLDGRTNRQSQIVYRPDIEEVRKHSCIFRINKALKHMGWWPGYTYSTAMQDMYNEMIKREEENVA